MEAASTLEKPACDHGGPYARRTGIQHRLAHEVLAERRTARVPRPWAHGA